MLSSEFLLSHRDCSNRSRQFLVFYRNQAANFLALSLCDRLHFCVDIQYQIVAPNKICMLASQLTFDVKQCARKALLRLSTPSP